jgi:hypothetical protein
MPLINQSFSRFSTQGGAEMLRRGYASSISKNYQMA